MVAIHHFVLCTSEISLSCEVRVCIPQRVQRGTGCTSDAYRIVYDFVHLTTKVHLKLNAN